MKIKLFTLLLMAVVSLPSLAQEASPAQYSVEIKKRANPEIPEGYASVTLTTSKMPDGTGYQMLLDANANTYGRIIPVEGPLTEEGNAPAGVYDEFEYKIPENADGDLSNYLNKVNIVIGCSVTIMIPAGIYDWCITNPSPADLFPKIYIASGYGNIGGRADNYLFSGGLEYEFTVTLGENGYDQTDVDIRGINLTYDVDDDNITYNSADVNWAVEGPLSMYSVHLRYRKAVDKYFTDCENEADFEGLEKWDADGDGLNWQYEEIENAHSGKGVWASYSYDDNIRELDPDNWLLLPQMNLTAQILTFWARSRSDEEDKLGVYFLPAGKDKAPENLVELMEKTEIAKDWTEYTINLDDLGEGQVVFRHFDSYDQWTLYIDDVAITPNINWITYSKVTESPYLINLLESGTKYEVQMRAEPMDWGESVFFTTVAPLVLEDNADNSTVLNQESTGYVKLNGRTLYKDGLWNTLCLPFDLTLSGSVLDGDDVELMTLHSSDFYPETGTLVLDFEYAEHIEAGKPYIIRWTKPQGYDAYPSAYNIVNPVFKVEAISSQVQNIDKGVVTFCGIFSPLPLEANDRTKLYLGADNTLYWPSAAMTIGACRAYFQLNGISAGDPDSDGARVFVLNFGDDGAAGISPNLSQGERSTSVWYSLDGRKLSGKPMQKGLYIHNGKKVVK